jgi:hypothetical protein
MGRVLSKAKPICKAFAEARRGSCWLVIEEAGHKAAIELPRLAFVGPWLGVAP